MSDVVIRVENLGKCYQLYDRPTDRLRELLALGRRTYHRPFWALRELDFEIQRGECIGLIGPNGAGKSTTLKILAGKIRSTTGTLEVRGRVSSILELGTGFQTHLTGRQNARVSALFLGLRPWEAERHIGRILDFAEIGEYADQPFFTYSSGMQARLGFSVLTTLDPEILILDEALATGDARFAAKCNEHLRTLCRSGCTTLVASHDLMFLAGTCDRVIWISQGRKVAEGPPRSVLQRYLDAKGPNVADESARPRYMLLRFEAEDREAQPTFTIHCVEWLDDQGRIIGENYLGEEQIWLKLLEGAGYCGFSAQGACAGWDITEISAGLNRRCRPHLGPGGAAYLTVPVPGSPSPVPSKIRVTLRHDAPCHAIVALQVDGHFRELGRIGRQGTVPPGTPPPEDFPRIVFDVARIFQTAGPMMNREPEAVRG